MSTGTSTGLGRITAQKFQKEGWNVVATMRRPEAETELGQLDKVLVSKLDVTDSESIESSLNKAIERFGGIDVLVNNAGVGAMGLFETSSEEKMRKIFEVNVFGLMNVTRAILPHFRKQKSGHIINVSSIVGRVGFPMQGLYHSTKFAVEGFSESLRHELESIGVQISLVEPGGYGTEFVNNIMRSPDASPSEYEALTKKYFATIEAMVSGALGDPEEVGDMVHSVASEADAPFRSPVGKDAVQLAQARNSLDDEAMYGTMKGIFGL